MQQRRQRGFGDLIQMLFIGVAIAAVSGAAYMAWNGFKQYIAAPYVADQIKADKVVIDTANSERDAANERAKGAEQDAKSAQAASALQTKALQDAEALAAAAQKAAREAGIKYASEVAKHAARISDLARRATAPVEAGRSCDTILSATDAILRESQRIVMLQQ